MMLKPRLPPLILLALALPLIAAAPSRAQSSDSDRYNIMKPEPWVAPKYRSPRAAPQPRPAPDVPAPQRRSSVPPPLYVPETGRVLPNMPSPSNSGPNNTETYQDRAVRCAHQAGAYGDAAGNRAGYIGSCINQ
jgi:hypothetical protein